MKLCVPVLSTVYFCIQMYLTKCITFLWVTACEGCGYDMMWAVLELSHFLFYVVIHLYLHLVIFVDFSHWSDE